jgi:UDP-N-acetylmuramoylalanine--D-glutamate ligase
MIAREGLIAVVGLGVSGLAAVRFLKQLGYGVLAFESSVDAPGIDQVRDEFSDVPVVVGPLTASALMQCTEVLLSPGVPRTLPAIQAMLAAGKPVTGDIDWFARYALRPILAVTGSNGKSTVVSWLAHVLIAADLPTALGGNIGIPALALLRQPEPGAYVLELSSFQLESTNQLVAEVACVLNVSEDHLDRYPSFEAYALTKQRIYRGAKQAVVNRADPLTCGLFPDSMSVHSFGLDRPEPGQFGVIQHGGRRFLAHGLKRLCSVEDLQLKGEHNIENALAVLAMGYAFGMPLESLLLPLQQFRGLPHRCEVVGERDGVTFYNDSKATNVGAAVAAIRGLGPVHRIDGKPGIVLLLGGRAKGADFQPLRAAVTDHVCQVYAFGEAAGVLVDVLSEVVAIEEVISMQEALSRAITLVKAPGAVLLAPACASFDQFSSFEARGDQFKQWVADQD